MMELLGQERAVQFLSNEEHYLHRVATALRRLRAAPESFGLCRECGEPIPFERLDALPHVRTCLACENREEAQV